MKYLYGLGVFAFLMSAPAAAVYATEADPVEALKARAETGDIQAEQQLAALYANPSYGHYSPDKAEQLYIQAASTGDANAEAALGYFYTQGPKQDSVKALVWLKKSAAQHTLGTVSALCVAYFRGQPWLPQDTLEALPYCTEGVDKGDVPSMRVMADILGRGLGGVTKDGEKALSLLKSVAANSQDVNDQIALAHGYYDGIYAPADYTHSFPLFHTIFKRQPVTVAVDLAEHYEKGFGTTQEENEAARLYLWAETQGDPRAMAWLATHPSVTKEIVLSNRISTKDVPPGVYTWEAPAPGGGTVPMSVTPYLTQSIANYYPVRALDSEVEGNVTAECHITLSGDFDNCVVLDETPPGYGFAKVTQKILTFVKTPDITHKDQWAKTYGGKSFTFTVAWRLGK